jgi:hypothetical protein
MFCMSVSMRFKVLSRNVDTANNHLVNGRYEQSIKDALALIGALENRIP